MKETVAGLFLRGARRFGEAVAVDDGDSTRTYRQLADEASRLANALRGLGLVPGDRVALMVEDRVEALSAYGACAVGGLVAVHVNARLKAGEIDHIISDSGARALVHTDGVTPEVDACEATAETVVVCIGDNRSMKSLSFADLVSASSAVPPTDDADAEDLAILAYTSGTTGRPKGAIISHRAVMGCVRLAPYIYRLPSRSRCCFSGSFSFIGAVWGQVFPNLYVGGSVRLLGSYDVDRWFDVMEQQGSTFTFLPTPHMTAFAEHVRRRPSVARTLVSVMHAGSTVPRETVIDIVDALGDRYLDCYGMTEVTGALTATTAEDMRGGSSAEDIFSSVGRAVPTARVVVVDANGDEIPYGSSAQGEIAAEVDTLFSGYWKHPDATAAVMVNGLYRTGDIGRIDAEGYVYVTDRKAGLIVSGGMNVYAAEVERVLASLEGIAEVAVVGVSDDRWGESVAAVVVQHAGSSLDERAVIDHAKRHMASYKKPTRVVFVDSLPRNASMKVIKPELSRLLEGTTSDDTTRGDR